MTPYHPDTDKEITRLLGEGHTPDEIAEELAIPVTHVLTIAPKTETRQYILDLWHGGIGKREISAMTLLPLPTIQTVIAAGSPHQRRPPRGPNTSPGTQPLGRIERTLAEAEASPRHRTRQLAARARALIEQIRAANAAEDEQRRLQQRVDHAARELANARAQLRLKQTR